LKNKLKDIFYFSRRDKNGIIILIVLILIVAMLRYFNIFEPEQSPASWNDLKKEIAEFKDSIQLREKIDSLNTISKNQKKYSNKKYASYNKSKYKYSKEKNNTKVYSGQSLLINLNLADSTELIKIYGIGPVLSKRIVKYRNYLGGFYKVNQLQEVYGVNSQLFNEIKKNFQIDTNLIKKININNADEKALAYHPYISDYEAKAITAFREFQNGKIQNLDDLVKNNIISDTIFKKINKYLSVN
jgi:DNA uptake protein ComE-like DNA-binding protein